MDELVEAVAPAPDRGHYQEVTDEADKLVIVLGSEVNAEREQDWAENSGYLPDDRELARYLARTARLGEAADDLAEIAQRVRTFRGDGRIFPWLRSALAVDSEPGPVHATIARLPELFERAGRGRHHPLIVTPKYDLALEHALRAQGEPYDVAVYVAREAERGGHPTGEPCFVHIPHDAEYLNPKDVPAGWSFGPIPITVGNAYSSFPIITGPNGGELLRTIVVRINGSVDDERAGFPWTKNFVITEDQYIDYLSNGSASETIPAQILAQLRDSCFLFLGYEISDWRLRVFLKRLCGSSEVLGSGAQHWAVERDPDELDSRLWSRLRVNLFRSSVTEYLAGLERFLEGIKPAA
jgi:SIR2-like domain